MAVARYGSVDLSAPPLWTRRNGKFPAPAPTYLPQDPSVQPPHAAFVPDPPQPLPPTPATSQSLVSVPARTGGTPDVVADEEHRVLLHHAKFLIQAGLAPMAKEPLQKILREVPGTPLAREARLTLDTIQN